MPKSAGVQNFLGTKGMTKAAMKQAIIRNVPVPPMVRATKPLARKLKAKGGSLMAIAASVLPAILPSILPMIFGKNGGGIAKPPSMSGGMYLPAPKPPAITGGTNLSGGGKRRRKKQNKLPVDEVDGNFSAKKRSGRKKTKRLF